MCWLVSIKSRDWVVCVSTILWSLKFKYPHRSWDGTRKNQSRSHITLILYFLLSFARLYYPDKFSFVLVVVTLGGSDAPIQAPSVQIQQAVVHRIPAPLGFIYETRDEVLSRLNKYVTSATSHKYQLWSFFCFPNLVMFYIENFLCSFRTIHSRMNSVV